MTKTNNKKSKAQLILSFTLVAVGLHMSIMFGMLKVQNIGLFIATHSYLVFFLILTSVALPMVKKQDPNKIGLAFLAITVFKMLFGIVLVYLFIKHSPQPNLYVNANFFGAFFFYLIAEVLLAIQELNS